MNRNAFTLAVAAVAASVNERLDQLAAQWEQAKADEAAANANRLAVEAEIIGLTNAQPPEGKVNYDGVEFEVGVTGNVTRSLDVEALGEVWTKVPKAIRDRMFVVEPKLVVRELKYVLDNEPEIGRLIAPAVTSKPAKPTISIKRKKPAGNVQ